VSGEYTREMLRRVSDRPMTLLRITISSVTIALLALAVYLLIALPLLQEPEKHAAPSVVGGAEPAKAVAAQESVEADSTPAPADSTRLPPATASGSGTRLIDIFGTVTDAEGQPLEDVLITEERYFYSTRSDAFGNYRLLLDLPYHRLPTLNFLRAGFRGKRIELTRADLQPGPVQQLDVGLDESADTLRLSGWVADDLGVPLEGVRIEISAVASDQESNFYLTVFSDERGNFTLEGVRSATHYRLTATLVPDYPVYSDTDFYLGLEPEQIGIVMKPLKFVDLAGMILTPAGSPVANFEMYINHLASGIHARKIASDSSGYFTLDHFPLGEVSLSTEGAEFYRISGLEIGEADYGNLQLVIDRGDHYLSGWVNDANGLPLEKAMVTLDATRIDNGVEYFSYRSQGTDANGKFSFANIAPGEHHVTIYATGFDKLDFTSSPERQSVPLYLKLTRSYQQ
jgi:protocatechuate 3,4-dioxygenase beta subunit